MNAALVVKPQRWMLRMYVAGGSKKSLTAMANLTSVCEEYLAGHYSIEVVDLLEHPDRSCEDRIVAVPTLIRKLPEPLQKITGDLSNRERTIVGLQLRTSSGGAP